MLCPNDMNQTLISNKWELFSNFCGRHFKKLYPKQSTFFGIENFRASTISQEFPKTFIVVQRFKKLGILLVILQEYKIFMKVHKDF